jgi:membrane-associated phospholipid phosphatase
MRTLSEKTMSRLLKLFLPITLVTWLCILFVDRPVALFVRDYLFGNRLWSTLTSSLPDKLLLVVVLISLASYGGHLYRRKKQILDLHTRLLGFIALSLPVSYGVRAILKISFGRVVTRLWIQAPRHYEFHWFHGGTGFNGFPSGHMIVFTTLFAAICRYQPAYKLPCYLLLGGLAVMLVTTNYHFVSDVIYGTYIGFLLEWCLDALYSRHSR